MTNEEMIEGKKAPHGAGGEMEQKHRIVSPCGMIPREELNKWRFKELRKTILEALQRRKELSSEMVEEYNALGLSLFHWNSGKEVAYVLSDGAISVGRYGVVGPRGIPFKYLEYDAETCYPCTRCKGKVAGEYGIID